MTAKFVKFQRPADFDDKLSHVRRLLDEIEEQMHYLDMTSADPDRIQLQLDQCMVSFWSLWTNISACEQKTVKLQY